MGISAECLKMNRPFSVMMANLPVIFLAVAVLAVVAVWWVWISKSKRLGAGAWVLAVGSGLLGLTTIGLKFMGAQFIWERGEFFSTVVAYCL